MNEPLCVKKARELGNLNGLKVIVSWLKKCNKSLDEIAKEIDVYDKTYGLNLSALDVASLLNENKNLCDIAAELQLCDKSNCELHKSPIERMLSDIDLNSVIINYTTGYIKFKIKGRNEIIKLEELIKVKPTKNGIETSYDFKLFFYMYLKTYLEPCDPNLLTPNEIEHMLEVLKSNAHIIEDISEDDIIENIFVEYVANLRYRKFNELGNCLISGRGFINEAENAMYVKASDIYTYIQDRSGYSHKKILEVMSIFLIKKNKSTSQVINVKHNDGRWEAYRFLILSLDAVKRLYKLSTSDDLKIEYETEETVEDEFEMMARSYQSIDKDDVKHKIIELCNEGINEFDLIDDILSQFKVTKEFIEELIDQMKNDGDLYQKGTTIRTL